MREIAATVLFEPPTAEQRFLPEGPYRCPDGRVSWVAIQHGVNASTGSLNVLDLATRTNQQHSLPGRPGFAFPTQRPHEFLIGLERSLVLFNTQTATSDLLIEGIDRDVTNTIINDGVVFDGHLVFGCKDLKFAERKAGLYLVRKGENQALRLDGQQICSNGKAVIAQSAGHYTLFDIDSPSKQILAWDLDVNAGRLEHPAVVVDLTDGDVFPDGLILTPDQQGLVVALYDPRASLHGEARCYDIQSGQLQTVWRCEKSPRVTCPQLIRREGSTQLLLTTADEGMSAELRNVCPHAGCLFVADTDFDQLNDNPTYYVP